MFRDDDDLEPLSTRKSLERADHGKQDKLDQKKKQVKERSTLGLNVLRKNVPQPTLSENGDTKAANPRLLKHDEKKQREAAAKQSSSDRDLIRQHEEEKRAEEEAKQEEQSEIG